MKDKLFRTTGISSVSSRNNTVDADIMFESHGNAEVTSEFVDSHITPRRFYTFLAVIILIASVFMIRLILLQFSQQNEYATLAQTNRQRVLPLPAERGSIFDRNGNELTKNIPKFSLAIIPQDLPRKKSEREELVQSLSNIIDVSTDEIRATIEEYGSYSFESIIVKENIDYETALLLDIHSAGLPGIHVQRGSKRLYFHPAYGESTTSTLSYSHIIGYEGKLTRDELDVKYKEGYLPSDTIGKTGLEKSYEETLRGEYGRKRIEVNALGKEQAVLSEEPPIPGSHIHTSIDSGIQGKLEQILQDAINTTDVQKASAVALNPKNGEVLAIVSLPTYNNNDFSGGISVEHYQGYIENNNRPLFNRAISGTYPSGSTIKMAVAGAALAEGIISKNTTFLSTGGIRVAQWFFPDWQAGGHGVTNVAKSLAWSVNTFYYIIGGGHNEFVGLGVDTLTSYLRKFGFASKLGIDLPNEEEGFLPSKKWKEDVKQERWYIGDTYNLSIGQGDVLSTPLQIASLTSIVANGGIKYKPHVVRSIQDAQSDEEQYISPEIIDYTVIAPQHISPLQQGMRECVLYGSCRRLLSLPINVAGKTGTAQWSSTKEPHAWFTSYAPYADPEIVLTIMLEEGESGSSAAVPLAEEFYYWWSAYNVEN